MISIKIENEPDSNWNQRLHKVSTGTIFQTFQYGQYFKKRLGGKPIYLKFYKNHKKLVAQLLAFKLFKGRGKLQQIFGRDHFYSMALIASKVLPKYLRWNFGPVIFENDSKSEIIESLGNFIISNNLEFQGSPHPLNSNYEFPSNFGFVREESATFIIDLRDGHEKILNNMDKRSARKNVKRSQERGVTITEIKSNNDLMLYYELQLQHRKTNNLIPYSFDDIKKRNELLGSLGTIGFLAWYNNNPVAGIFINTFNGYISQSGSTRSIIDTNEKLHSQDLLKWHIINWGIEHDCNYYDLAGVNLNNPSIKETGIYKHKKKWGGKLITFPTYTNMENRH